MKLIQKLLGRSDIGWDNQTYMKRWRFFRTRWFGLRFHHILRSDDDRELHDHPFTFISFILTGGYWEHTMDGRRTWYGPGSIVVRNADTLHKIELKDGKSAWTFVITGPLTRQWGFWTDHGWVPSAKFWEYIRSSGRSVQWKDTK